MEDRLEREVQVNSEPAPTVREQHNTEAVVLGNKIADDALDALMENEAVQGLVQRILEGTEPYDGTLHRLMPQKFTPRHINMVMLHIAGFRGVQIAEMLQQDRQNVYWTLRHPWTKKLKMLLVPQNAVRVIDIRTRMDAYAGDLMDYLFEKTIVEEDTKIVASVTFGMLDRSGYAPVQKNTTVDPSAPGASPLQDRSTLARLAAALESSNRIDSEIMPSWVPAVPPEIEGRSVGTPDGETQSGDTSEVVSTDPSSQAS